MTMHYDEPERQLAVARWTWRSMLAKKRKAVANAVAGIRCTPAPRAEAVSGALRMLKRDIFLVAVERNVSEVVVDPARLTQLAWRQASKP
jgi:hypothetical protein